MSTLADKPAAVAIVPDSRVPTLVSCDSESGPTVGPPEPVGAVMGGMTPVGSGDLNYSAYDTYVGIARGGTGASAEWVYAEADGNWMGKDDPRQWQFHHAPCTTSVGYKNGAVCYLPAYRRIVIVSLPSSGGQTMTVTYRGIDDTPTAWTTGTQVLDRGATADGEQNLAIIDLPDGRLLLAVRWKRAASDYDYDIYQSEDGGTSFVRVVRGIMERFGGNVVQTASTTQPVRLARSGEFIRLCHVDVFGSANKVRTWVSTDRGISWSALAADSAALYLTNNVCNFDIVGVDDAGRFLLAQILSSDRQVVAFYVATGFGAWTTGAAMTYTVTRNVYAVTLCRHPLFVYAFIATEGDEWLMGRAIPAGAADPQDVSGYGWHWNEDVNAHDAPKWVTERAASVWAGNAFFTCTSRTDSAFAAIASAQGSAWYSESWNEQPLGEYGPGIELDVPSSPFLWNLLWHPGLGTPGAGAGASITTTTSGTGSVSTTPDAMVLSATTAGSTKYYEWPAAVSYTNGGVIEFIVKVDSGDSAVGTDNVAVRVRTASGGSYREFSIRVSSTQVIVYDHVGAATRASLTIAATNYLLIRMTYAGATSNRLDVCDLESTGTPWQRASTYALTSVVAAGSSYTRFGHLGQTQSTEMKSYWRRLASSELSHDEYLFNQGAGTFPANESTFADLLFGATCSPVAQETRGGIAVAWAGIGAAEGNYWLLRVNHNQGANNIWRDSPRLLWKTGTNRAGDVTNSAIAIYDIGGAANRTGGHSAAAVFNCNERYLLLEWDTSTSFASPESETIDMTRFGTGTTPLTVSGTPQGTELVMAGVGGRFVAGDLVGCYVQFTTGAAVDVVLQVSRHPTDDTVYFDDTAGTLVSYGVASTDELVVFGRQGAKVFSTTHTKRYLRITTQPSGAGSFEGYAVTGTLVLGRAVTIDVPIQWEHDDEESDLVTEYRTASGVAWGLVEGPSARRLKGTIIGDAEQFRARLRGALRQIGGPARAAALILDSDRPSDTVRLGRFRSSGAMRNQGWIRNPGADNAFAVGDVVIDFEEQT